jgi:hypothetical protein
MRRLFIMALAFFLALTLFACVDDGTIHDEVFQSALENLFSEGDSESSVTQDLFMPVSLESYRTARLSWASSDPSVIATDGTVTRPVGSNVTVTLTLTVVIGIRFETYSLDVTVLRADDIILTFVDGSVVETLTVTAGSLVTPPDPPFQDAFVFIGWSVEGSEDIFDFASPVFEDTTFLARWQDRTYDIVFDSRGGTSVLPILDVIHSMTLPDIPVPLRDGYTFVGWIFIDGSGNEQLLVEGESIINMDIEAFALWVKDLMGE